MKTIVRLLRLRVSDFINKWKYFGINLAFFDLLWWICFYLRPPFAYQLSSFAMRKKTGWLDKYIGKRYADIIERYKNNPPIATPIENVRIWVFWGQGEENMPPLIAACYRQLTKYNSNVTLVTNQNVNEYITLPSIIFEKVKDGRISWAHFSDIVRNTLLAQYGGLWLDATVWVSGPLPINRLSKMNFFTANGYVPKTRFSVRFWTSYQWNWSTWCMWAGTSNYLLYTFVSEMLQAIAQRESYWPDYVIQDYLFFYACRMFPSVKEDMEASQKWRCDYRNELASLMNQSYDEEQYRKLVQSDFFFKLSFRSNWKSRTNAGRTTYYGKLINNLN